MVSTGGVANIEVTTGGSRKVKVNKYMKKVTKIKYNYLQLVNSGLLYFSKVICSCACA